MSEPVVGLGKNLVKSGNYPNLTLTKKVIQKIPFYWHASNSGPASAVPCHPSLVEDVDKTLRKFDQCNKYRYNFSKNFI